MNRQQRRALARQVERNTLRHPVPASVSLRGGPMDGWVVKPGAPALRPDWYRTWPSRIAAAFAPGRYAALAAGADGVTRAVWQAL